MGNMKQWWWRRLTKPQRPAGTGKEDVRRYTVGICAMDKKARSKQMNHILERLNLYGEFDIIIFGDHMILNQPIEEWPVVQCLLSWHSDGFPLAKAQAYAALRKPFLCNDLQLQDILLDRILVYRTLVNAQIPVPQHIIVDRTGLQPGQDPPGFIETEDYVELNGQRICKPFVEKPGDAEDHNIWIYYQHAQGGGVKKLFRKIDNKSSHYDVTHSGRVRRDGSYVYEEFLATGGTDVKVYTVGPSYAHAEARKSPVVDGKVLRTADGKEMRFPVLLTPQEKEVARLVVNAFKQNVCGFDLLRSDKGVSYVCDVNGWSFVKNSRRYYDDTAGILRSILIGGVDPLRLSAAPSPMVSFTAMSGPSVIGPVPGLAEDDAALLVDQEADSDEEVLQGMEEEEMDRTDNRTQAEELRCVLAVIRHGDRTPKQKLKLKVTAEPLLALFHKHKDGKGKQAKLKTPGQLQELLDITRDLLLSLDKIDDVSEAAATNNGGQSAAPDGADGNNGSNGPLAAEGSQSSIAHMFAAANQAKEQEKNAALEFREKLRIVKTVLEQASFNGINRKVQLKPTKWGVAPASSLPNNSQSSSAQNSFNPLLPHDSHQPTPQHASDQPRDLVATRAAVSFTHLSPMASGNVSDTNSPVMVPVLEEALMVVKWGGVLTHAGRQQAEDLGKVFRLVMYPRYGSSGGGLLRLHSTYRHDLKIYTSDEGRVQASAAAFAKGLLDLEGTSLTPILVSLVKKDASMLEAFGKGASDDISKAKSTVYKLMTDDPDKAISQPPAATPPASPPRPSGTIQGTNVTTSPGSKVNANDAAEPSMDVFARPAALQDSPAGKESDNQAATRPSHSNNNEFYQGLVSGSSQRWSSTGQQQQQQQLHTGSTSQIKGMPDAPLALLRRLVELMKALVGQLRELCLQERMGKHGAEPLVNIGVGGGRPAGVGSRYSSVSHEPAEWVLEPDRPCSGERMLLMFDRWQKLQKSFYNEKKDVFDISKVPDIYDSAKYDAIHNSHLKLDLRELYNVSKQLADAVIPNEYGVDPAGKLRIGSTIAAELLGKLLVDLAAMREESLTNPDVPINPTNAPSHQVAANKSLLGMMGLRPPTQLTSIPGSAPSSAGNSVSERSGTGLQRPPSLLGVASGPGHSNEHPNSSSGGLAHAMKEVGDAVREKVHDVASGVKEAMAAATSALDKLGIKDRDRDSGSNSKNPSRPASSSNMAGAIAQTADRPSASAPPAILTEVLAASDAVASTPAEPIQADISIASAPAAAALPLPAGDEEVVNTVERQDGAEAQPKSKDEECGDGSGSDNEGGRKVEGDTEEEVEAETIHRLCPEYVTHINSPLRHVRTRIYFTSESHIHSLVNTLRFCHLWGGSATSNLPKESSESGAAPSSGHQNTHGGGATPGASVLTSPTQSIQHTSAQDATTTAADVNSNATTHNAINATVPAAINHALSAPATASSSSLSRATSGAIPSSGHVPLTGGRSPLLSTKACALLDATTEFDYLTHVVLRMYENKAVPVESPERFRVEIMFSSGANCDPFELREKAAAQAAANEGSQSLMSPPTAPPGADSTSPSLSTATSGMIDGRSSDTRSVNVRLTEVINSDISRPESPVPDRPSSSNTRGESGAGRHQTHDGEVRRRKNCRGPSWHVMPVKPRQVMHDGTNGVTLNRLEEALLPMAKVSKFAPPSYMSLLAQRGQALGSTGTTGSLPPHGTSSSRLQSRFNSSMNIQHMNSLSNSRVQAAGTGTSTTADNSKPSDASGLSST